MARLLKAMYRTYNTYIYINIYIYIYSAIEVVLVDLAQ